jgi:hypothetical protein
MELFSLGRDLDQEEIDATSVITEVQVLIERALRQSLRVRTPLRAGKELAERRRAENQCFHSCNPLVPNRNRDLWLKCTNNCREQFKHCIS